MLTAIEESCVKVQGICIVVESIKPLFLKCYQQNKFKSLKTFRSGSIFRQNKTFFLWSLPTLVQSKHNDQNTHTHPASCIPQPSFSYFSWEAACFHSPYCIRWVFTTEYFYPRHLEDIRCSIIKSQDENESFWGSAG